MKKYFLLCVLMSVLLSATSVFGANIVQNSGITDVAAISEKASSRFMKKDMQGAIEYLNQAIKIYPNNPQLYLNRGFVKHVTLDYEGAMQDYNAALKVNPNFVYAYNNRGALKAALNDINGAMQDYAAALNINSNYSDVYYNRGNLKYMTDDLQGALADYDKAIELNPKDAEAYNNRGVVKKRLNYNVGALSDYSQAIAINPKDSIAYANRGHLKKLYFDNEGAAIDLNQAVELAEHQTFIKNVKPLLSTQRYIAAVPAVASFAYDFTESDNSDYSGSLLSTNAKSEKIALASVPAVNIVPKFNKALEQKPVQPTSNKAKIAEKTVKQETKQTSTPVLSTGIGKVTASSSPDIRTTVVTKEATTNIKLAESYYIRGLQKCVLRDLQGAVADLDKAIANNSKYADAYLYRAAIKKELGDKDGFKKDYSTAIQLNPSLQSYNDSDALSLING